MQVPSTWAIGDCFSDEPHAMTSSPPTAPCMQVPSVWAIGDVTHRMDLTPVALMEGKALAATLFGGKPTVPDYDNVSGSVRGLLAVCLLVMALSG